MAITRYPVQETLRQHLADAGVVFFLFREAEERTFSEKFFSCECYCWWKKSGYHQLICSFSPLFKGFSTVPGGAGFFPSTVLGVGWRSKIWSLKIKSHAENMSDKNRQGEYLSPICTGKRTCKCPIQTQSDPITISRNKAGPITSYK